MCTVLLPPGVNPIAVDQYINTFPEVWGSRASQSTWTTCITGLGTPPFIWRRPDSLPSQRNHKSARRYGSMHFIFGKWRRCVSPSRSSRLTSLGTHWMETVHASWSEWLYKRKASDPARNRTQIPGYPTCGRVTVQTAFRFLKTDDLPLFKTDHLPLFKTCWLDVIKHVLYYRTLRNHVYRKNNSAVFKVRFTKSQGWAGDSQGLQRRISLTPRLVVDVTVVNWIALLFSSTSLRMVNARWICGLNHKTNFIFLTNTKYFFYLYMKGCVLKS
jgi:hypothetical protein